MIKLWKKAGREAKLRKSKNVRLQTEDHEGESQRKIERVDDVSWGEPVRSTMVPLVGMGTEGGLTDFTQLLQCAVDHAVSRRSPTVFEGAALQAIVQFKWETNVFQLVRWHLLWHMFLMLLASVSMVAATQQQLVQKRSTVVDVLQGATAVCVLVDVLLNHVLNPWFVSLAYFVDR